MKKTLDRRTLLLGSAAAAGASALPLRAAFSQGAPLKLGLMTIKTGSLAEGGIQMEQGLTAFLKDRNDTLAGRKVELIVADTGGSPAGAKNKVQELVERDGVDVITGPLAAFELLAITDYIAQHKVPTLSLAAAEDMTQRKPNPYFLRASATSAQAMQPLADFAAKDLKLKRVICIAEDFAFGYEQMGGFQRVFEDNGGKVLKKLWAPLGTADLTPYIAQIADCDAVIQGFAGSAPVKFIKQYADAGMKYPVLGGETAADDALMKSFSDEAIGMITAVPYTADLANDANKHFLAAMAKEYNAIAGQYAALLWLNGQIIEAALAKTGGKSDDKDAFIAALRAVTLADSLRGPVKFDHFGNVIGNIYVRRMEKKDGKLVNTTIKTYHDVSQFWTYDEKTFLSQPVYSRDYPPIKS
ncbi:MAG TPA: ABC transporter substrate-binding protein [Stellaceae bacterium]|nr:ABC transporter substrate-binding protein [Stellaceae bacterium]